MNIFQFGLVHVLALFRLVIHELPEEHPQEAQRADDDESHLPAEVLGQRRDQERSGQRTHGGACIEDGSGEGAVLLGEVLGRGLDGGREVAALTQCQDAPAQQEEIDTHRRDGKGHVGSGFDSPQGGHGIHFGDKPGGGNAAAGMHHGTQGPDANSNQVSLLGTHPVHELAGKEAGDGVEDGEQGGDGTVVRIRPVELGSDKLLIGKGQDLTVQVVHGSGHKQKAADPPPPIGH